MFIQLYTELCKYAINIDKGNIEREKAAGNMEEVKKRKLSMSKTCVRMAFMLKEYDFRISRICGLTAFTLDPTTDNLNLVNKLYWTIKNTSAVSRNSKIDIATVYEIERLLGQMRPEALNPDYSWKQLIPVCKKFKQECDLEKIEDVSKNIPETVTQVDISQTNAPTVEASCSKTGDKWKSGNKGVPKEIERAHLAKLLSQKNLSREQIEKILSEQFPRNTTSDLGDAPALDMQQLDKTIDALKKSIYAETFFRESLEKNLSPLSRQKSSNQAKPKQTVQSPNISSTSKLTSQGRLLYQQLLVSKSQQVFEQFKQQTVMCPPNAHSHHRRLSTSAASPSLGASPPPAHSTSCRMSSPSSGHSTSNPYLGGMRSLQGNDKQKVPFHRSVSEQLSNKIHAEMQRQTPAVHTNTFNILRPPGSTNQECAKIAQEIAEMHEKQRLERARAQGKLDATRAIMNAKNIPSSSQISNLLSLTFQGSKVKNQEMAAHLKALSAKEGVSFSLKEALLQKTYGGVNANSVKSKSATQSKAKVLVTTEKAISQLKPDKYGNVTIGDSQFSTKPMLSLSKANLVKSLAAAGIQSPVTSASVAPCVNNQRLPVTVTSLGHLGLPNQYQGNSSDIQQQSSYTTTMQTEALPVQSQQAASQADTLTGLLVNEQGLLQTSVGPMLQNLDTLATASLSLMGQDQQVVLQSVQQQQLQQQTVYATMAALAASAPEPIIATPLYTVPQTQHLVGQPSVVHASVNIPTEQNPVQQLITLPNTSLEFSNQEPTLQHLGTITTSNISKLNFEQVQLPLQHSLQVSSANNSLATIASPTANTVVSPHQQQQQVITTPELSPAVVQQILSTLKQSLSKSSSSTQSSVKIMNQTSVQQAAIETSVQDQVNQPVSAQLVGISKNDPSIRQSVIEATKKIMQLRQQYDQKVSSAGGAKFVTSSGPSSLVNTERKTPSILQKLIEGNQQQSVSSLKSFIDGQPSVVTVGGANVPDLPDLGAKEFHIDEILGLAEDANGSVNTLGQSDSQGVVKLLPPSQSTYFNANRIAKERELFEKKKILSSQFQCQQCKKLFSSKELLKTHIDCKVCGKEELIKCQYCKKQMRKRSLNTHQKKSCKGLSKKIQGQQLKVSLESAEKCTEQQLPKLQDKEQIKTVQSAPFLDTSSMKKCTSCLKYFSNTVTLQTHINAGLCGLTINNHRPADAESFKCGICEHTFKTMNEMKEHVKKGCVKHNSVVVHNLKSFEFKKLYRCVACSFMNSSEKIATKHVETCPMNGAMLAEMYQCSMCGEMFEDKDVTIRHVSRQCPQLKQTLSQKQAQQAYDKLKSSNMLKVPERDPASDQRAQLVASLYSKQQSSAAQSVKESSILSSQNTTSRVTNFTPVACTVGSVKTVDLNDVGHIDSVLETKSAGLQKVDRCLNKKCSQNTEIRTVTSDVMDIQTICSESEVEHTDTHENQVKPTSVTMRLLQSTDQHTDNKEGVEVCTTEENFTQKNTEFLAAEAKKREDATDNCNTIDLKKSEQGQLAFKEDTHVKLSYNTTDGAVEDSIHTQDKAFDNKSLELAEDEIRAKKELRITAEKQYWQEFYALEKRKSDQKERTRKQHLEVKEDYDSKENFERIRQEIETSRKIQAENQKSEEEKKLLEEKEKCSKIEKSMQEKSREKSCSLNITDNKTKHESKKSNDVLKDKSVKQDREIHVKAAIKGQTFHNKSLIKTASSKSCKLEHSSTESKTATKRGIIKNQTFKQKSQSMPLKSNSKRGKNEKSNILSKQIVAMRMRSKSKSPQDVRKLRGLRAKRLIKKRKFFDEIDSVNFAKHDSKNFAQPDNKKDLDDENISSESAVKEEHCSACIYCNYERPKSKIHYKYFLIYHYVNIHKLGYKTVRHEFKCKLCSYKLPATQSVKMNQHIFKMHKPDFFEFVARGRFDLDMKYSSPKSSPIKTKDSAPANMSLKNLKAEKIKRHKRALALRSKCAEKLMKLSMERKNFIVDIDDEISEDCTLAEKEEIESDVVVKESADTDGSGSVSDNASSPRRLAKRLTRNMVRSLHSRGISSKCLTLDASETESSVDYLSQRSRSRSSSISSSKSLLPKTVKCPKNQKFESEEVGKVMTTRSGRKIIRVESGSVDETDGDSEITEEDIEKETPKRKSVRLRRLSERQQRRKDTLSEQSSDEEITPRITRSLARKDSLEKKCETKILDTKNRGIDNNQDFRQPEDGKFATKLQNTKALEEISDHYDSDTEGNETDANIVTVNSLFQRKSLPADKSKEKLWHKGDQNESCANKECKTILIGPEDDFQETSVNSHQVAKLAHEQKSSNIEMQNLTTTSTYNEKELVKKNMQDTKEYVQDEISMLSKSSENGLCNNIEKLKPKTILIGPEDDFIEAGEPVKPKPNANVSALETDACSEKQCLKENDKIKLDKLLEGKDSKLVKNPNPDGKIVSVIDDEDFAFLKENSVNKSEQSTSVQNTEVSDQVNISITNSSFDCEFLKFAENNTHRNSNDKQKNTDKKAESMLCTGEKLVCAENNDKVTILPTKPDQNTCQVDKTSLKKLAADKNCFIGAFARFTKEDEKIPVVSVKKLTETDLAKLVQVEKKDKAISLSEKYNITNCSIRVRRLSKEEIDQNVCKKKQKQLTIESNDIIIIDESDTESDEPKKIENLAQEKTSKTFNNLVNIDKVKSIQSIGQNDGVLIQNMPDVSSITNNIMQQSLFENQGECSTSCVEVVVNCDKAGIESAVNCSGPQKELTDEIDLNNVIIVLDDEKDGENKPDLIDSYKAVSSEEIRTECTLVEDTVCVVINDTDEVEGSKNEAKLNHFCSTENTELDSFKKKLSTDQSDSTVLPPMNFVSEGSTVLQQTVENEYEQKKFSEAKTVTATLNEKEPNTMFIEVEAVDLQADEISEIYTGLQGQISEDYSTTMVKENAFREQTQLNEKVMAVNLSDSPRVRVEVDTSKLSLSDPKAVSENFSATEVENKPYCVSKSVRECNEKVVTMKDPSDSGVGQAEPKVATHCTFRNVKLDKGPEKEIIAIDDEERVKDAKMTNNGSNPETPTKVLGSDDFINAENLKQDEKNETKQQIVGDNDPTVEEVEAVSQNEKELDLELQSVSSAISEKMLNEDVLEIQVNDQAVSNTDSTIVAIDILKNSQELITEVQLPDKKEEQLISDVQSDTCVENTDTLVNADEANQHKTSNLDSHQDEEYNGTSRNAKEINSSCDEKVLETLSTMASQWCDDKNVSSEVIKKDFVDNVQGLLVKSTIAKVECDHLKQNIFHEENTIEKSKLSDQSEKKMDEENYEEILEIKQMYKKQIMEKVQEHKLEIDESDKNDGPVEMENSLKISEIKLNKSVISTEQNCSNSVQFKTVNKSPQESKDSCFRPESLDGTNTTDKKVNQTCLDLTSPVYSEKTENEIETMKTSTVVEELFSTNQSDTQCVTTEGSEQVKETQSDSEYHGEQEDIIGLESNKEETDIKSDIGADDQFSIERTEKQSELIDTWEVEQSLFSFHQSVESAAILLSNNATDSKQVTEKHFVKDGNTKDHDKKSDVNDLVNKNEDKSLKTTTEENTVSDETENADEIKGQKPEKQTGGFDKVSENLHFRHQSDAEIVVTTDLFPSEKSANSEQVASIPENNKEQSDETESNCAEETICKDRKMEVKSNEGTISIRDKTIKYTRCDFGIDNVSKIEKEIKTNTEDKYSLVKLLLIQDKNAGKSATGRNDDLSQVGALPTNSETLCTKEANESEEVTSFHVSKSSMCPVEIEKNSEEGINKTYTDTELKGVLLKELPYEVFIGDKSKNEHSSPSSIKENVKIAGTKFIEEHLHSNISTLPFLKSIACDQDPEFGQSFQHIASHSTGKSQTSCSEKERSDLNDTSDINIQEIDSKSIGIVEGNDDTCLTQNDTEAIKSVSRSIHTDHGYSLDSETHISAYALECEDATTHVGETVPEGNACNTMDSERKDLTIPELNTCCNTEGNDLKRDVDSKLKEESVLVDNHKNKPMLHDGKSMQTAGKQLFDNGKPSNELIAESKSVSLVNLDSTENHSNITVAKKVDSEAFIGDENTTSVNGVQKTFKETSIPRVSTEGASVGIIPSSVCSMSQVQIKNIPKFHKETPDCNIESDAESENSVKDAGCIESSTTMVKRSSRLRGMQRRDYKQMNDDGVSVEAKDLKATGQEQLINRKKKISGVAEESIKTTRIRTRSVDGSVSDTVASENIESCKEENGNKTQVVDKVSKPKPFQMFHKSDCMQKQKVVKLDVAVASQNSYKGRTDDEAITPEVQMENETDEEFQRRVEAVREARKKAGNKPYESDFNFENQNPEAINADGKSEAKTSVSHKVPVNSSSATSTSKSDGKNTGNPKFSRSISKQELKQLTGSVTPNSQSLVVSPRARRLAHKTQSSVKADNNIISSPNKPVSKSALVQHRTSKFIVTEKMVSVARVVTDTQVVSTTSPQKTTVSAMAVKLANTLGSGNVKSSNTDSFSNLKKYTRSFSKERVEDFVRSAKEKAKPWSMRNKNIILTRSSPVQVPASPRGLQKTDLVLTKQSLRKAEKHHKVTKIEKPLAVNSGSKDFKATANANESPNTHEICNDFDEPVCLSKVKVLREQHKNDKPFSWENSPVRELRSKSKIEENKEVIEDVQPKCVIDSPNNQKAKHNAEYVATPSYSASCSQETKSNSVEAPHSSDDKTECRNLIGAKELKDLGILTEGEMPRIRSRRTSKDSVNELRSRSVSKESMKGDSTNSKKRPYTKDGTTDPIANTSKAAHPHKAPETVIAKNKQKPIVETAGDNKRKLSKDTVETTQTNKRLKSSADEGTKRTKGTLVPQKHENADKDASYGLQKKGKDVEIDVIEESTVGKKRGKQRESLANLESEDGVRKKVKTGKTENNKKKMKEDVTPKKDNSRKVSETQLSKETMVVSNKTMKTRSNSGQSEGKAVSNEIEKEKDNGDENNDIVSEVKKKVQKKQSVNNFESIQNKDNYTKDPSENYPKVETPETSRRGVKRKSSVKRPEDNESKQKSVTETTPTKKHKTDGTSNSPEKSSNDSDENGTHVSRSDKNGLEKKELKRSPVRQLIHGGKVFQIQKGSVTEFEIQGSSTATTTEVDQKDKKFLTLGEANKYKKTNNDSRDKVRTRGSHSCPAKSTIDEYISSTLKEICKDRHKSPNKSWTVDQDSRKSYSIAFKKNK